ncbi:hypothetical protein GCM10007173_29670 [Glutamicibacter ardleyensis]|uniref:Uncharacterized protein n=1 Tax=Glutamicibacter ardleyensis TaxID=225894 RepID=A0ABQ2DTH6_9MICC|nr:hypothetical protein GCM10007173_29670 [Glutamicibacter ardleyensis]
MLAGGYGKIPAKCEQIVHSNLQQLLTGGCTQWALKASFKRSGMLEGGEQPGRGIEVSSEQIIV